MDSNEIHEDMTKTLADYSAQRDWLLISSWEVRVFKILVVLFKLPEKVNNQ
jgi:hypothetical protein